MKLKSWLQKRFHIKDTNELRSLIIQFLKFSLVGVSNTLVSWVCYYTILWIDDRLYMLGSLIGTIVSIANAFYWNDTFVFNQSKNDWKSKLKRLCKTYVSYGGTSLLGMILLWFEVTVCGLSKVWAPPINLIITIPINYLINKFWTFKK